MKLNIFSIIFAFIVLISCSNKIIQHGYTFEKSNMDKISVNKTSSNEILEIFGSPTLKSQYYGEVWYYISTKMSSKLFFPPKLIQRDILAISFNNQEVVSDFHFFTLDNNNNVQIDKNRTFSNGTNNSPITHFLKNMGKFEDKSNKRVYKPRGF